MENLGDFLRREREFRGISIVQVAQQTKVNLSLLQAIEHLDWERIPCRTYMRGHLRAYAQFIGLDTEDLILRYEQQHEQHYNNNNK